MGRVVAVVGGSTLQVSHQKVRNRNHLCFLFASYALDQMNVCDFVCQRHDLSLPNNELTEFVMSTSAGSHDKTLQVRGSADKLVAFQSTVPTS